MNFKDISAAALPRLESLLREWLPQGKLQGREYKVGSLTGEPGRSLSINVDTGVWKDFSTGDGGADPISLLAAIRNCSQSEAAREIDGSPAKLFTTSNKPKWEPLLLTDNAPAPTFAHAKYGQPSAVYSYLPHGYICRFDYETGKEILPRTYCEAEDGKREWKWLSFGKPRPLYNLADLAKHPTKGVLIVEGEKAADAAAKIAPAVVVTWPGGAQAHRYADWSPLKGRKVLIWPDADQPGIEAARAIQTTLRQIAESVRIVMPPTDVAEGWDAADAVAEGWDRARLVEHFKPAPEPPPGYEERPEPRSEANRILDLPFRILGCDGDSMVYMPDNGQQLVALTASGHTKNNLMRLAPLNAWEAAFAGEADMTGKGWDAAVNALIQRSQAADKFDPRIVRGRGCWIDGQHIVYHAGNRLFVDGAETEIPRFDSPHGAIYAGDIPIQVDRGTPASNAEAVEVAHLCEMLCWERPLFGKLLAGWLAAAPVCGALGWRPHIWITGPSGSGKSWTVANIVQPLVGPSALHVQGDTSEAGIRQHLGSDALPVVFDEAESEDRAGMARVDKVLQLARQASTETGAAIVKGSATGGSVSFLIRSMFLFASIGVAAVKKQDISRIAILSLRKNDSRTAQDDFRKIQAKWLETIGQDGFPSRFRARSLKLARVIRANAETFKGVAFEFTGDNRSGDQVGTLLAGAYSLSSSKEISKEAAREWMAQQDWVGFRDESVDRDENQCLTHLFAAQIRFDLCGHGVTKSVQEMIEEVSKIPEWELQEPEATRRKDLSKALIRHGMRLEGDRLLVANQHPALSEIFDDTQWARGKWKDSLSRQPGALRLDPTSFGPHVKQRAVSVVI
jgi:putative DNA primase/helicase